MSGPTLVQAASTAGRNLLLVDLCGTLYDSNTTFDFLRYLLADNVAWLDFDSSSRRLAYRIANRFLPGDVRRKRAVSFLKGMPRHALLAEAKQFLATTPVIVDVRRRVDELRQHADSVILVSSSLDFIVEAARDLLHFDDYRATTLQYSNGHCEGTIASDLLGAKHRLIDREFGHDHCILVTDNRDDAQCRHVVDRLIGVADAAEQKAMAFWQKNSDEVLVYKR